MDSEVEGVTADPRALQQVLLNVLTNALDACETRESPRVVITAAVRDDEVVIEVEDNGTGLSPDRLRTPFRPFASSKPGHNGLGLVVCRRLMTQMGGTIAIDSAEGYGATVTLRLPRVDSPSG